jgi:hypothetical protein
MGTALARLRPWKVARETVMIDNLSNGRFTLGVGLGFPADQEFRRFGEDSDNKLRAAKLDEAWRYLPGSGAVNLSNTKAGTSRWGTQDFSPLQIRNRGYQSGSEVHGRTKPHFVEPQDGME